MLSNVCKSPIFIRIGLYERFHPFADLSIAMSRQIFIDCGRGHYAAKNKQARGRSNSGALDH